MRPAIARAAWGRSECSVLAYLPLRAPKGRPSVSGEQTSTRPEDGTHAPSGVQRLANPSREKPTRPKQKRPRAKETRCGPLDSKLSVLRREQVRNASVQAVDAVLPSSEQDR